MGPYSATKQFGSEVRYDEFPRRMERSVAVIREIRDRLPNDPGCPPGALLIGGPLRIVLEPRVLLMEM